MSFDARLAVIGKHKGYDYEEITVADAAIGFTASKLATQTPPKRIYVTCEIAQIRLRYDGENPTTGVPATAVGHPINPFDTLYIEGLKNMKNFRAIRTGDNSAKLRCTYER